MAGCAADEPAGPEAATVDLRAHHPIRLQQGTRLVVYGVTDDDFVLFQDGGTIFAAPLLPGAARRTVAEVGAVQPIVFISGRVAFVWTAQPYFGRGGLSPLVVWTAAGGPRQASAASLGSFGGTQEVAVRPDGREILFVTNANADATVGDIVSATPELHDVKTLVAGVSLRSPCAPLVGYDGRGHRGAAHPVIGYCPAGATAGALARWVDGRRSDLAADLALPPTWSSDTGGHRFFTILGAARTPVSLSARGEVTVLEDVPTANGFIDRDDSIVTGAIVAAGRELHRFTGRPPQQQVIAQMGNASFYIGHHAQGFRHYTDSATSRDGRLMLFADSRDPVTSLTNLFLVDISATPPAPVQLQSDLVAGQAFELFTRDSSHGLYYTQDVTTGGVTLHAASLAGDDRPVSSGAPTELVHYALNGTLVAYSDRLIGTGVDLLDRNDVVLADVGAEQIAPVTLAEEAYNLFFPTPDRHAIVYTSDHDPAATGLFLAIVH